jgi:hypothetical protein
MVSGAPTKEEKLAADENCETEQPNGKPKEGEHNQLKAPRLVIHVTRVIGVKKSRNAEKLRRSAD